MMPTFSCNVYNLWFLTGSDPEPVRVSSGRFRGHHNDIEFSFPKASAYDAVARSEQADWRHKGDDHSCGQEEEAASFVVWKAHEPLISEVQT